MGFLSPLPVTEARPRLGERAQVPLERWGDIAEGAENDKAQPLPCLLPNNFQILGHTVPLPSKF